MTLKNSIATSAEGFPLLGTCVYWSFSEVKVSHKEFIGMLDELGIDKTIAPPTRHKSAVQKALKSFVKSSNKEQDQKKAVFSRKVVDDKDLAAFAVVQPEVNAANFDLDFNTELKVRMDKKTKNLLIDGTEEAKTQLNSLVEEYKDSYTTDQIRSTVLRYIHEMCKGITVRDNGGIYFVPSTEKESLLKLESLFKKISNKAASCSVDTIPVIDTAEASKAMWKALVGEANRDLQDFRKDLEAVDADLTDRAQERRFKKYQDLRLKIEMYETLLNGTATDLKQDLKNIEMSFRRKIGAE